MKDEIKEILKILKKCENGACITKHNSIILLDYITNLQEENEHLRTQVNTYENPDDMTLFYMWIDEKAKDKMKQLEKENERLKEEKSLIECDINNAYSFLRDYKSRIDKARHKLDIMFSNGNEDIILDDLLELDKILGG